MEISNSLILHGIYYVICYETLLSLQDLVKDYIKAKILPKYFLN